MSIVIVPTECPYCGRNNDLHDSDMPEATPDEGSVSLCWRCRQPSIFTLVGDELVLRKPTGEELAEILAHPVAKAALAAMAESYRPSEAVNLWRGAP